MRHLKNSYISILTNLLRTPDKYIYLSGVNTVYCAQIQS